MNGSRPTLELEYTIRDRTGSRLIAGFDEAGRGALAGPVVAAAVVLPLDGFDRLIHLDTVKDSKQLSAKRRDRLYDLIVEHALAYGIGSASAGRIDREGIMAATKHAMRSAYRLLDCPIDYLLIDGRALHMKDIRLPQQMVTKGDRKSMSIAAASILAKVTRDRYMRALGALYTEYGFERHKGYGTKQHLQAIKRHGPLGEHRHSFAPIRQSLL